MIRCRETTMRLTDLRIEQLSDWDCWIEGNPQIQFVNSSIRESTNLIVLEVL